MTAAINTKPPIGRLRTRSSNVADVPVGTTVRTPTGSLAVVIAHVGVQNKGGSQRRDSQRLVCRYLKPSNKRFAIVRLLPELVEVIHGT